MVGIFRRRGVKLFLGTVIGVPLVAVVGAAGYVQYRISTRPPEHTFQPLVSATGELQLEGVSIAAPTRWDLTKRVFELLRIFLPLVALYYVVVLLRPARHRWWLRKLKEGVERAGPAFVKAGQWACTRNDLFSREFRDVFKELYSETSVHSFADTERIVEADLGAPLSEVFRSFDPVPVGSGSIGQVHSGVLKDGRRVAVKVMHPGVVETIAKDFFIINNIASWVHNNVPSLEHYNVRKIGLAWTNHLAAQLDFRIEAEHLHLFRKHFNGTDYVRFPEPYRATQHVLIEEFCPGEPATPEFLGAQDPSVRDVLAGKGLNCYCKMLLRDNFIHGDLHPGNILVDARDPANPVVTLIDVGLCQKMTIREGQLTHELMGAFVRWVPGACSTALWNMGDEQLYADKAKFDGDMVDLFKRFRPISGDEVEVVNNVLQAVFDVVRVNRVTMEPTFVSILFAVLVLESFIMALNPEFNMVRHASGWLVSEGHISKKLFKNIAYSAEDIVRSRARMLKARLTGQSEKEDYVPAQRRRMEERMLAEHQERFGAATPVPVAVAA